MHIYQITDDQGTEMQIHAPDLDAAQERFIDLCEQEGQQHGSIVRIVRVA